MRKLRMPTEISLVPVMICSTWRCAYSVNSIHNRLTNSLWVFTGKGKLASIRLDGKAGLKWSKSVDCDMWQGIINYSVLWSIRFAAYLHYYKKIVSDRKSYWFIKAVYN